MNPILCCTPCHENNRDRWQHLNIQTLPPRTQQWCLLCGARRATITVEPKGSR